MRTILPKREIAHLLIYQSVHQLVHQSIHVLNGHCAAAAAVTAIITAIHVCDAGTSSAY